MRFSSRWRAGAVHLAVSACLASFVAVLVFYFWYPFPYGELLGSRGLFALLVFVDVILGPLITLVVFNNKKSRKELTLDLALIVLIQVSALAYGVRVMYLAKPEYVVFEYDRFRVLQAMDAPIERPEIAYKPMSATLLKGPQWIALRAMKPEEKSDFLVKELDGVVLAAQPELWVPYDTSRIRIAAAAKPLLDLLKRFPDHAEKIDQMAHGMQRALDSLSYLPIGSHDGVFWTVVLDENSAEPLAFLPIDPY